MTPKERAAMQQALEALESYSKSDYIKKQHPKRRANGEKAITALREALAEQAEQEPFKMICPRCKVDRVTTQCPNRGGIGDCPMTATAQSAAPVRTKYLTDDDYAALLKECRIFKHQAQAVERLIKAKSRKQIDLTDEEIKNIANEHGEFHNQFARAVIAADREKNK